MTFFWSSYQTGPIAKELYFVLLKSDGRDKFALVNRQL